MEILGGARIVQLNRRTREIQHFPQIPDRFVTDQLHGLAGAVLQVFRHSEGVLVGVFIKPVQQADLVGRANGVAVQQLIDRSVKSAITQCP
jgi:hypothetical protein